MAQNSAALNMVSPTNALSPLQGDATLNLLVAAGEHSKLNIAAATVVKVGTGRVVRIINSAGVAGFTVNDCATTGAATAANTILVAGTTVAGQVFTLDFPFATGLVISVVGASGVLAVSYT